MRLHLLGNAVQLACFGLFLCTVPASAAKTVFRIDSMHWRDPHLTVDSILGCLDLTDTETNTFSFNNLVNTALQTDGDGDDILDLNYIFVFDEPPQLPSNGLVIFEAKVLCSPPVSYSACWYGLTPALFYPADYVNWIGPCNNIEAYSVEHTYTPGITLPSGPCFTAYYNALQLDMGGVPLPLIGVTVGATYDGYPETGLINGLIKGFIREPIADQIILPASLPGGGQPLSSLFPGGTGNCSPWSDKDLWNGTKEFPGWYVYLNFTAKKVTLYEGGPTAVGDGAPELMLDAPYPNPFNPSTEVHYTLPHAARVQVAIYDAGGRVVSELVDGDQVKGTHSTRWDGRDARGGMASSGVYFVRLSANGEVRTQKMVLLK